MTARYDSSIHLARVTPIDPAHADRVLDARSQFANAIKLIGFQTLWVWFAFAALAMNRSGVAILQDSGLTAWCIAAVLLVTQFGLLLSYPEWPVNRSLCRKLRENIAMRKDVPVWCRDDDVRVVELIPREHWCERRLETASDLLVLKILGDRIELEGDRDRYWLPATSLVAVELEEVRHAGWLCPVSMIVMTVRTASGVIELPISLRDHSLGNLWPSRRREQAIGLLNRIEVLANGYGHGNVLVPRPALASPRAKSSLTDRVHTGGNPYAVSVKPSE